MEEKSKIKYTPDRYKNIKEGKNLTQEESYNKLIGGLLQYNEEEHGR